MPNPNSTILYVANPTESAAFYARVLGKPPVEQSPNFAMFALDSGAMLGLWATKDVQPAPTQPGGSEIGFAVGGDAAVDAVHAEWRAAGMPMAQPPTDMDFGRTFVALDPDGHRLRVFSPR